VANGNFIKSMIAQGYTNQDAGFSFSELASPRAEVVGQCYEMVPYGEGTKLKNGKKRYRRCSFVTHDRDVELCPNCRKYLVWQRKRLEAISI
jgi:hypothetical protein